MFKKVMQFIEDVRVEMKKVVWPEREELINSTIVVIIISGLFTIFIFLTDTIVSKIVKLLY